MTYPFNSFLVGFMVHTHCMAFILSPRNEKLVPIHHIMGESDDDSFYDINNWAHQKLYGDKANEDFSYEFQEKALKRKEDEKENFEDIKNWIHGKLSNGVNEISSEESTERRKGSRAMGENGESFEFINNWAHKKLYGHYY